MMLLQSDVLFEYITFSILPRFMLNTIVKEWSHANILRFNACKYDQMKLYACQLKQSNVMVCNGNTMYAISFN